MTEQDDYSDEQHETDGGALRKQMEKALAEAGALKQENALLKAGLSDLDETKRIALLAVHKGDLSPDGLRETAANLGWAEKADATDPATEQAAREASEIADQTSTAGMSAPGEIRPEDVAGWPEDAKREFMKAHPRAWDRLKRKQSVQGIVFTP